MLLDCQSNNLVLPVQGPHFEAFLSLFWIYLMVIDIQLLCQAKSECGHMELFWSSEGVLDLGRRV